MFTDIVQYMSSDSQLNSKIRINFKMTSYDDFDINYFECLELG